MEIERKFLIKRLPCGLESCPVLQLSQAYISTDPVIRIRKSNDDFYLTMKGEGTVAREEHEMRITGPQYEKLLAKAESAPLEKTRYLVPLEGGLTAELDVYHGALAGLATVEVEFESLEDAENFAPPEWFGKDVSADLRYRNNNLVRYGTPGKET
ncbi:MAG: CYTH domain-containing protein [Defluviitaleaceae bacterium]|nr:CYTH domain-containing protein [Defluviitaleaceae bacterium]